MYCMEMVDATGILTVPGSGFGQKEDTYHYRMTNLVTPTSDLVETLENLKKFNAEFHAKFEWRKISEQQYPLDIPAQYLNEWLKGQIKI